MVLINRFLPTPGNLGDLPFYLTYTQEVAQSCIGYEPTFPVAFRHTWSLAIEEQFYIFWPVMVWLVGRRGLYPMALITVSVAVLARAWGFSQFVLISRCDGLALGGLLAGLIGDQPSALQLASQMRTRFMTLSLAAPAVVLLTLVYTRLLNVYWPGAVSPRIIHSLKLLSANLVLFAMVGRLVFYSGCSQLHWLAILRWCI